MLTRDHFLNVSLDRLPAELYQSPKMALNKHFSGLSIHIISLNIEQIVMAQDDLDLALIINEADLIIPDGIGALIASKILVKNKENRKKLLQKKLAGIDLAAKLVDEVDKIAILGAKAEVIDRIKTKFASKIVFAHHGYYDLDHTTEIMDQIVQSQPELLLVAMGIPKQEKLIYELKNRLENCICMGVGGALDVWSEELKRAPQWMIRLNLEWFFRIIQEPYRLKRFLYNVYRYVFLLLFNRGNQDTSGHEGSLS